jgi:hypothetical protein
MLPMFELPDKRSSTVCYRLLSSFEELTTHNLKDSRRRHVLNWRIPHIIYMRILITYRHTKFKMPSFNGLLVIAIKTKGKKQISCSRDVVLHSRKINTLTKVAQIKSRGF